MKHLILLTIFLVICDQAFSVRRCYVCEDCDESHLQGTDKDCRPADNLDQYFLCEVRVVKGKITRSCIENNNDRIHDCDEVNRSEDSSCLYCDRELCNSATVFSTSLIFGFVVFVVANYF